MVYSFVAFADEDNDGVIDINEFSDAWDYLLNLIKEDFVKELGLTDADILKAVLVVIAIFAISLPFLYYAISLWSNTNNFTLVIQSLFIGATGIAAHARSSSVVKETSDARVDQCIDLVLKRL